MMMPFRQDDIPFFLGMARSEGWICDRWEFDFMLQNFSQGCLVCREEGKAIGYITSMNYGKSGWIGNLLVSHDYRRRGIGRGLLEVAISTLLKSGVERVWLTASEKGAELYRRLGFVAIDHIYRWTGTGTGGRACNAESCDFELVREVDREGWGERRDSLLQVTCDRGRVLTSSGGFICCQPWEAGMQIGAWGCVIRSQAEGLLDQALTGAGRVFLDVPAGNHQATALLEKKGFKVRGSNLLMYLGAEPRYQPKHIYALASMGSMG